MGATMQFVAKAAKWPSTITCHHNLGVNSYSSVAYNSICVKKWNHRNRNTDVSLAL